MNRNLILSLFCTFLWLSARSQVAVQAFGGTQGAEAQLMVFKHLDSQKKLDYFNFTFFLSDYASSAQNSYESYQVLIYNLTSNVGLLGGGRFTPFAFQPEAGLNLQIASDVWYAGIFPSVRYAPQLRQPIYAVFGMAEFRPQLTDKLGFFAQIFFEPNWLPQAHYYSYQQTRIGLSLRNTWQFGIGLNSDWTGPDWTARTNPGFFLRRQWD